MKTKWRSLVFLGLVSLLISSLIGCGESYTQEDLESKYEALLLERVILKAELETMQADIAYLRDVSGTLRDDYNTLKAEYDALKVLYDDVTNELTEIKKPSEPESDSEVKGIPDIPSQSEEPEEEQVIKDLAYIKATEWPYSDDADPEYEGVSIHLNYYNSKSERITPSGVSVEVTVELYWYTNYPIIYQEQVTINYTGALTELFGEVIRISFDSIGEKPSGMTRGPILILTVSTPNQGKFEVQNTIIGFIWP